MKKKQEVKKKEPRVKDFHLDPKLYDEIANEELMKQASEIANGLKTSGIDVEADREIIALIAYLQRLGTDIYKKE